MRDVNEVSEGRDGLKAKCESYGGISWKGEVGQTTEETTPIDEALVADLAVHNLRVALTSGSVSEPPAFGHTAPTSTTRLQCGCGAPARACAAGGMCNTTIPRAGPAFGGLVLRFCRNDGATNPHHSTATGGF